MKNKLISNSSFSAIHAEMEANRLACVLTPEEEAAAGATIERIEADKVLTAYVLKAHRFYGGHFGVKDIPDWLKFNDGDWGLSFDEFFANAGSIADAAFWDIMALSTSTSLEAMRVNYEARLVLAEKESLDEGARLKVRVGIDVRDFFMAGLKLFGYSAVEVEGVVGV